MTHPRTVLITLLAAAFVLSPTPTTAARAPTKTAASKKRAKPAYDTKPGVVLSEAVIAKLQPIAERYRKATRRRLLVTSGTRSPRDQAAAMYGKLRAGSRLRGYRNQKAIAPLRAAYDKGRRKRWKKSRIVSAMATIVQGQVDRGVYISKHLRAGAFDVRSIGMSRSQKRALRRAVREVGGVSIAEERRPPHFHLQLR